MKYLIAAAVLTINISVSAQTNDWLNANTVLREKFIYNVSWSFIRLGTITLKVEDIESYPDLLKVTLDVKTAPHLPFIDIDEHNVAVMRISDGMTFYYKGREDQDGNVVDVTCVYDQKENCAVYEIKDVNTGGIIKKEILKSPEPFLIGTSLIQYARLIADSGLIRNVPTIVRGNFYPTKINYCGPIEEIEINAWSEPVSAFKYTGYADWKGKATAGLSGRFTGWFSDDTERVVVYAEMEIFLGSIDVELEKWYKPSWVPPSNKKLVAWDKK